MTYRIGSPASDASEAEAVAASLSALFDQYSSAVYGLATHILGASPEAEAVTEEVFVRAWRCGVVAPVVAPVVASAESAGALERAHPPDPRRPDSLLRWLLRMTQSLALALLAPAPQRTTGEAAEATSDGPSGAETAVPNMGVFDEVLSPDQRYLLARVLWSGETIATIALATGRTRLEVTRDLRVTMDQVRAISGPENVRSRVWGE